MPYYFLVSAVLVVMLATALRDWMRMRRYARLLTRWPEDVVTTPATITGVGGPFGSTQYRFRFDDEKGRSRRGRFYVTTAQRDQLAVPRNLARDASIAVTYARRDPACVYMEPYRSYYLSYLRRGSWFLAVFMGLVTAGLVVQAARIAGWPTAG